jgi:hypothetical protein
MMKVAQMKRTIPIVKEIQCTYTNEDQAYMNIPTGSTTAAQHTRYKRASGPLVGKYRLESRKTSEVDSLDYIILVEERTGIMILGKSS